MAGRSVALLGRAAGSLALLLFAALAFVGGLDRLSLQSPGLARLVPTSLSAQSARARANTAIALGQPEQALAAAREAVAADPVKPTSTSLLGTAYLLGANDRGAEAAFRVAARFGWREPPTQLYWYEAAIQSGDMPRAVDRVDALLRVRPALPGRETLLAPIESDPAGRAALLHRLKGRPLWLSGYLRPDASVDDAMFDRRGTVLIELAASGTRLGCEAIAPFVDTALARGLRGEAEATWVAHCPGASLAQGLADGGFDRFGSEAASPFGWKAQRSGDVTVRAVEEREGSRLLRMRNRASVSRMVLRQALSLEPGIYRLVGRTVPGRVAASLGCGRTPPVPSLVDGDLAGGGQTLRVIECPRLELGLWLRPGPDEVSLDDLELRKVG